VLLPLHLLLASASAALYAAERRFVAWVNRVNGQPRCTSSAL
jgi:hypothetical protein